MKGRPLSLKSLLSGVAVALTCATLPAVADAATNPYERGPDPTVAALAAPNGPYRYTRVAIGDGATPGFGTAIVWAPSGTTEKFGGVAIAPGFLGDETSITWLGPRLASRGFVVITINTPATTDLPPARATALRAALRYLINSSPAKALVDPTRLAVVGHSMGGGATLEASKSVPTLKAAIGLNAFNTTTNWSTNVVPTLLIAHQADSTAPPTSHSIKFYNSIPATTPKAYLQFRTGDHLSPTKSSPLTGIYVAAWLKRFVDNDERYTKFFCPTTLTGATSISRYNNTCETFQ